MSRERRINPSSVCGPCRITNSLSVSSQRRGYIRLWESDNCTFASTNPPQAQREGSVIRYTPPNSRVLQKIIKGTVVFPGEILFFSIGYLLLLQVPTTLRSQIFMIIVRLVSSLLLKPSLIIRFYCNKTIISYWQYQHRKCLFFEWQ